MPRRVMKRVKFVKLTKIKKIGCVLIKQFSCVNEILGGVRSTCTNVGASRRIICIFAVNCHEVMGEKDGHFNSSLYAANGKLGWRLV